VDVEKANDSHYVIDFTNVTKLAETIHCKNQTNELVHAIGQLIRDKGETGFVKYLEENGIEFGQFHFDDYPEDLFD